MILQQGYIERNDSNRHEIKILSVGSTLDLIDGSSFFNQGDIRYSFDNVSFSEFLSVEIAYDLLLFIVNKDIVNKIESLYYESKFLEEPPVILIYDGSISEKDLSEIPFRNKLLFKGEKVLNDVKYNLSLLFQKIELEKKIDDLEWRFNKLSQLKDDLILQLELTKKENDLHKININELSATNEHLISATWRERDLKKQLKQAMDDLQKSKDVIEIQNRKISESINYSRRIQNVILPDENCIKKDLKESFIYYLPKDVVSGDFPFYYKRNNRLYFAAVDCTGHGVPGAMLSLIGNLELNNIMLNSEVIIPGDILKTLNDRIVKILKQNIEGNDTSDGMDIALCLIDKETNILNYSGAHRPLYQVRNNTLTEFKGTRLAIGGKQMKKEIIFTNYEIKIEPGDLYFICSDGYPDQFGGPAKIKYGSERVKNFLILNSHLKIEELKDAFEKEFVYWKGEERQMDDVLLMAFKL